MFYCSVMWVFDNFSVIPNCSLFKLISCLTVQLFRSMQFVSVISCPVLPFDMVFTCQFLLAFVKCFYIQLADVWWLLLVSVCVRCFSVYFFDCFCVYPSSCFSVIFDVLSVSCLIWLYFIHNIGLYDLKRNKSPKYTLDAFWSWYCPLFLQLGVLIVPIVHYSFYL